MTDWESEWCYHARLLGNQYLCHDGRGVPVIIPCYFPRKSISLSWWTRSLSGTRKKRTPIWNPTFFHIFRLLFYSQNIFTQAVLTRERCMVKGHLLRSLLLYSQQHVLQKLFFLRGTDGCWKHAHTATILLVYNWFIYIAVQFIIEIDNYKIK